MGAGTTPGKWWRRAVAAAKDKRSVCLTRLGPLSPTRYRIVWSGVDPHIRHYPLLEAAVIKATSHDETRMDYKNAGRVFAWARTSPATFLRPLMWVLSCRVEKTHCWAVALKALMITHGVLLCCGAASAAVGRLPFDLSAFRDRSSWGLSAFVRAYFGFLDQRCVLLNDDSAGKDTREEAVAEEAQALRKVERMQDLLELLMQVRPYGDQGAANRLLLEAMDGVVVEIFEVYSTVCSGIAYSLVGIFGPCSSAPASSSSSSSSVLRRCNREWGATGIRLLRRAAEQSTQLSSYLELSMELGVLNAADVPPVQRIPDEDIEDLEALLLLEGGGPRGTQEEEQDMDSSGKGGGGDCGERQVAVAAGEEGKRNRAGTVVTEDWVVFENEAEEALPPAATPPTPSRLGPRMGCGRS
ncbi:hypothetical protein Taro_027402 [Colocasia esculenta]|uniref:ENTH domain-containing protein n=1 Tax=Colocasia esculenta TaxID=4460 RepID=A0A843VME0_COLES|nr:hypothetical protein [Colocasia esculenta]